MKKSKFFERISGVPAEGPVLESNIKNDQCAASYFLHRTNRRFDFFVPSTQERKRRLKKKLRQPITQKDEKLLIEEEAHFSSCLEVFQFADEKKFIGECRINRQPDELFKEITEGKLKNVYITGAIGCGKTTYLTKLIYLYHKQKKPDNYMFVFDLNAFQHLLSRDMTAEEKILSLLKGKINNYLHENYKIKVNVLREFWEQFNQIFPNTRTVFAFDNIDTIYDDSLKNIVATDLSDSEKEEYLKNNFSLAKALTLFRDTFNSSFPENNKNNVSFIYAMRPQTYTCISRRGTADIEENLTETNSLIYLSVRNPKNALNDAPTFVNKVINKRLNLYETEKNKKMNNIMCNNLKKIAKLSLVHSLHGLRHVMHNLSIAASKETTIEYPEWMIAMFLFLDNKGSYSQNKANGISGVVNIFLVNSQYRIDNQKDTFHETLLKEHAQSYWLKYFIVCAIHDQTKDIKNNLLTNFNDEDIYNTTFRKYEKHIYKLCIYSLSEVSHGRLIACESPGNDSAAYKLWATYRLHKSIKEDLFFSFDYLAAIVDDAYLEFPLPIAEQIGRRQIYQSFFPNKHEIGWWQEWLKKSISKVFMFLKIVECSLEHYERHFIDSKLYQNYKPNFIKIKRNIDNTILSIGKDLRFTDEETQGFINTSNNVVGSKKNSLDDFFKNYKQEVERSST